MVSAPLGFWSFFDILPRCLLCPEVGYIWFGLVSLFELSKYRRFVGEYLTHHSRLDTAVPSSLNDMVAYQKALAQVLEFANRLDDLRWPGADSLHDWVTNAPKIWLSKRRETALDWTRNQFSLGNAQRPICLLSSG